MRFSLVGNVPGHPTVTVQRSGLNKEGFVINRPRFHSHQSTGIARKSSSRDREEAIAFQSAMACFKASCQQFPIFNLDTIIPLGRRYGLEQLPLTTCFRSGLDPNAQFMGRLTANFKVSLLTNPVPQTTASSFVLGVDIGGCPAITP